MAFEVNSYPCHCPRRLSAACRAPRASGVALLRTHAAVAFPLYSVASETLCLQASSAGQSPSLVLARNRKTCSSVPCYASPSAPPAGPDSNPPWKRLCGRSSDLSRLRDFLDSSHHIGGHALDAELNLLAQEPRMPAQQRRCRRMLKTRYEVLLSAYSGSASKPSRRRINTRLGFRRCRLAFA